MATSPALYVDVRIAPPLRSSCTPVALKLRVTSKDTHRRNSRIQVRRVTTYGGAPPICNLTVVL
ncbi:hypothetical protein [Actinotignum urinale]|uniref:hypothetical protein n=1 Tax=Actinotignum urinale TaxID=190146 RepID=UPI0012EC91ED|nr:hypothetical protein [Actinotignum urinale]MDY5160007.1 hypothetical protein [Actinotignum urinale]